MTRIRNALAGFALGSAILAVTVHAHAASPALVAPTPESGVAHVTQAKVAAYRSVLEQFDAAIRAQPRDAAIAVARCRFIENFTDEDYGEYVESAPDDFEACAKNLESKWPNEPDAQLFALQRLWGEEAVEQGEKLVAVSKDWPKPLRRALLSKVSEALQGEDQPERAGELAVMAAFLGEPSSVATAVTHLARRKEFAAATALLRDAPLADGAWPARKRIEAALALPDPQAALAELRRYAGAQFEIAPAIAARAYLRAGDVATASKLLSAEDDKTEALKQVRFDVAIAADDMTAAAQLVDMTDTDQWAANAQRFAIVATRAPGTLMTRPMLMASMICLLAIGMIALLPGLLLVPIHYRGLIREMGGNPPFALFHGIGLRHAWYGLALMLCVPLVVAAVVSPDTLATLLDGESLPPTQALFQITAWGTGIGLLCATPIVAGMGLRNVIGDRAALKAWWQVLLAWAIVLAVGWLLSLWHQTTGDGGETMQTKMVDALAAGSRDAGPLLTLLVVALLAPIFEEIIFRGVVLGGLSRYISFGWANLVQALLFAAIHDDLPRFPYYFTLGLLAGALVKRTQSLGPAIALHVLNNLLAFSLRM
jgi:membrane protease YdiL (CAAX protease family)